MANDPKWYDVHLALIDRVPSRPRGEVDTIEATAAMKIQEATSISEAVSYLNLREQALVLATPELFTALSNLSSNKLR